MRLPRFSALAYLPWYSTPSSTPTAPATVKVMPKLGPRRPSTNTIMATIPPSSNPRGELIFSSRVDKTFREGYERYRAAFERRREEKSREERGKGWKGLWGRLESPSRNSATPTPPTSRRGTPPPGATFAGRTGRTPSPGITGREPSPGAVRVGSGLRTEGNLDDRPGDKRERADSYSFVLAGLGHRETPVRPHT